MKRPKLGTVKRKEAYLSAFSGYVHKPVVPDGFFYDMENMSGARYPAASPRDPRGTVEVTGAEIYGLLGRDRLWSLRAGGDGSAELFGGEGAIGASGYARFLYSIEVGTEIRDGVLVLVCPLMGDVVGETVYVGDGPETGFTEPDGKVTETDAQAVLQASTGSLTLPAGVFGRADVDGDGKITANDAYFVQQAAGGNAVLRKLKKGAYYELVADFSSVDLATATSVKVEFEGKLYDTAEGTLPTAVPERGAWLYNGDGKFELAATDPKTGRPVETESRKIRPPARRKSGSLERRQVEGKDALVFKVWLPGDVNGDGKVSGDDAVMARQWVEGTLRLTPEQLDRADVDMSGAVDADDVRAIVDVSTGKIKFPEPVADMFYDMFLTELDGAALEGADDLPVYFETETGTLYPAYAEDGSQLTGGTFPTDGSFRFADGGGSYGKDEKRFVLRDGENARAGFAGRDLVSMGGYIVNFSNRIVYDTLFSEPTATDAQKEGRKPWFSIDAYYPDGLSEPAELSACILADNGCETVADVNSGSALWSATAPASPKNGDYWFDTATKALKRYGESEAAWISVPTSCVKIKAAGIARDFSTGDAVKITGLSDYIEGVPEDGYVVIEEAHEGETESGDWIIVTGFLKKAPPQGGINNVTVSRTAPEMDFVVEYGNRLWGCSSAAHEIYASALGDPTNWRRYQGLADDSYAATVGTPGAFTGAAATDGYVLFFKETAIVRVYGNRPSNFEVSVIEAPGVQRGSAKSVAVLNGAVFYKGVAGVYVTEGGAPSLVSEDLGNRKYADAVGGRFGDSYAVSMRDAAESGEWNLFVYDTARGVWRRHDATRFLCCAAVGDELYFAVAAGYDDDAKPLYAIRSMGGSLGYSPTEVAAPGATLEKTVGWFLETGPIRATTSSEQVLAQIRLLMTVPKGCRARVLLRYDGDPLWEEVWSGRQTDLRTSVLPIVPRRCGTVRIRVEGDGFGFRLYGRSLFFEQGSELRGDF